MVNTILILRFRSFHFMRDHPEHGASVLGSAWGVAFKYQSIRKKWKEAWMKAKQEEKGRDLIFAAKNVTGPDQEFLNRYQKVSKASHIFISFLRTQLRLAVGPPWQSAARQFLLFSIRLRLLLHREPKVLHRRVSHKQEKSDGQLRGSSVSRRDVPVGKVPHQV